jgi:thiamine biosynthesis lipoprotein
MMQTVSISPQRFAAQAMGTAVSWHIDCENEQLAKDAWQIALAEIERCEQMFSTFRPSSEVSRINRGELHLLDAAQEVVEVLDACTWLEHLSGGVFRARRPDGSLDPAGFVKGWAVERAAQKLRDAGLNNWYVGAGGDIQTCGTQISGDKWTVGVVDPHDESRVRCTVDIPVDYAIATSGTSARGMHIWDGTTNALVSPVASFTVIGPQLMWADALATTGFVMGEPGVKWVEETFPGYVAFSLA